ncbi:LOW QUALITY PROTEIN: hormone-sensitive lipase-like [Acropora millepora]|uniref:LOW QUALITY PROTEIN: hormone-sensitive lipase-like n=1 Tax=Acropora millepora TaxID=45264 RepID=UPI001CF2648D|nr:LOW QUALITY PROTEIN: hormone-sensitive lipase-like [Acropora millepora]
MAADESSSSDLGEFSYLPILFKHLRRILDDNIEYFERDTSKAVYKKFYDGFKLMTTTVHTMEEVVQVIAKAAPLYDFSVDIKGNGYRSLITIVEHSIRSVTDLAAYCQTHRDRFYFRWHHYSMEVEAFANLFCRIAELLQLAKSLINDNVPNHLFHEHFDSDLLIAAEQLDRECFYGRTLGFQFPSGMSGFLQVVCVAMASFAEGYLKHKTYSLSQATVSILNSGKYTVNPEMRAKQVAEVTQNMKVDFCKAFWNLTETYGIQHVPLFIGSALKVNRVFFIPPESFEVKRLNGETVSIVPPCSWSRLAPVQVRLLSYTWRKGQSKDGTIHQGQVPKPKSDGLLVHIHGGGFVAQSSKSHEMYLRSWAKELGVPILSIDYSLSPEAPFPRALEECFFVYAWCLNNFDQLGTTGKFLCLAGDSAGGNLSVSLSMRASEYGIRVPDSILAVYSCFNAQWIPSPSRLLAIMDPLLPMGVLAGCLGAYAGLGKSPFDELSENVENAKSNPDLTGQSVEVESKDSRYKDSAGSFHTCLGSQESSASHVAPVSNSDAVVSSGQELGYESGLKCQENSLDPHSRSQSEDSVQSRSMSPQGGKHGTGHETDHIAVHYHSDVEGCHVVNVAEEPGSPNGKLLLFPVESPADDGEEDGMKDVPSGMTTALSQVYLPITKNPYMSPVLAPDELLKSLPPIDLVACSLDPLFDDSVEFAKRLHSLNNDVELYILDGLPHGFLGFHLVSQEAREGNNLCIVCLKRTLTGKRTKVNAEKPPVY